MNIVCQPADLISYMQSAISTFRQRMPQISEEEINLVGTAIEYQHQLLMGKISKKPSQPFAEMSLNELFSLVVRCADCGHSLQQALAAQTYDKIHYERS